MPHATKPASKSNDPAHFRTDIKEAQIGSVAVGPGSHAHSGPTVINNWRSSRIGTAVVVLLGVAACLYFVLFRCTLAQWDDAVRGWAKIGHCPSPEGTGYFIRVSYKQGKDASLSAVRRAWRTYVAHYCRIGAGACPHAREIVFFDPQGNAGAGIFFDTQPPGWAQMHKDHPEWMPLDAKDQPVHERICFFRAAESRRPAGW